VVDLRASSASDTVQLLGAGRIAQAPRMLFSTDILWTAPDAEGVRSAAEQLGYKGGTSMSFLRLNAVVLPSTAGSVQRISNINNRLNLATAADTALLAAALPIV
jgi:hypothetical protein